MARPTPEAFVRRALADPANAALLSRLPTLGLCQCFLTAGCLFQATPSHLSGRPAGWGVNDYDVSYFDDRDLSWEAEDAAVRRVRRLARDLGVEVEARNQARVHLWYGRRFGAACPELRSARDGIDRVPVSCTCVGIEAATGDLRPGRAGGPGGRQAADELAERPAGPLPPEGGGVPGALASAHRRRVIPARPRGAVGLLAAP